MEEPFNVIFKGVASVLIMYIAGNSIFRYHSSIRLVLMALCLFGLGMAFFFFDQTHYVAMAISYGILFVVSLFTMVLLQYRKEDIRLLISIYDKNHDNTKKKIEEICQQTGIPGESISYLSDKPYLICFHQVDNKSRRSFMKALDQYLTKQPLRFTLCQYLHVVIALILLIAIWRF
jgi:Ca2+/Na+ antiporter